MYWIYKEIASIPIETSILFALAMIVSAGGFYRVVYFISIGYAASIAAMAVCAVIIFFQNLTLLSLLQSLLLAVYGLRLGTFLIRREFQPSYQKELESVRKRTVGVTFGKKILIWIGVSLLYVMMFSPCLFSLSSAQLTASPLYFAVKMAGLITMIGGLFLETLADKQKSDFKEQFPNKFCDVGLYRWVRCPNYLGEIIFWTGNWMMGLPFYTSILRWIAALIGLACIVLIMMGSTKRLESEQSQRYGNLPDYQEYLRAVPVLFPFVPLYTLKNIRVYLE
jgi:steroid 5-alpha reductase family enzyme